MPHNGDWAKQIIAAWEPRCGDKAIEVPLIIASEEVFVDRTVRECLDPSRPSVIVARYRQASAEDVDRAVACGVADEDGWRTMTPRARFERLGHVAEEFRKARGDLIGAALADGGKTISEADPEVSEAIDFVEFLSPCQCQAVVRGSRRLPRWPMGVVVVVSTLRFFSDRHSLIGGVAAA